MPEVITQTTVYRPWWVEENILANSHFVKESDSNNILEYVCHLTQWRVRFKLQKAQGPVRVHMYVYRNTVLSAPYIGYSGFVSSVEFMNEVLRSVD